MIKKTNKRTKPAFWGGIVHLVYIRNFPKNYYFLPRDTFCVNTEWMILPAGNYMFKVNNRNTRTMCEIC